MICPSAVMEDLRWVEMFSWARWQEGGVREGSERVGCSCRVAHKRPRERMLSSEEAAGSRWSPAFRPSLQLRSVKPDLLCQSVPSPASVVARATLKLTVLLLVWTLSGPVSYLPR